jgi:hypothetical protein
MEKIRIRDKHPGSATMFCKFYPWGSIRYAFKKEHPALQNMIILSYFFLFLWDIIALLNLDPDPHYPHRS